MISAETGSGLDRLKRDLAKLMPQGPWLYPEDQIADAPMRALAAEITREKIFERLHDELPYQITVETENRGRICRTARRASSRRSMSRARRTRRSSSARAGAR